MRILPFLCALLLGVGAALVAGCGDRSNLIPSSDAGTLSNELDAVRQAVDDRRCGDSRRAINRARSAVANLPESVDDRLKSRLLGGIGQLAGKAATSCDSPPATTQETIPTTETTAPVEPTTTAPEPTTPADPTTGTPDPDTPVDPAPTDPDAGGGLTPTDPGTGITPVPDPGGAEPGPGFDARFGRDGDGTRPQRRRDQREGPGYFP